SITAQEMALWLPESSTTASSETYALANGTLTASLLIDRSVATTAAGQFFTVTLRAQNTGSVPTDPAFTVTITAIGGACGGGCTGVPVKMPYLSGTLFNDWSRSIFGCGDTAVYSWTFTNTVGGEGCVAFTATIAGLIGGTPVTAAALSTCLTVVPRPPAKASLVS